MENTEHNHSNSNALEFVNGTRDFPDQEYPKKEEEKKEEEEEEEEVSIMNHNVHHSNKSLNNDIVMDEEIKTDQSILISDISENHQHTEPLEEQPLSEQEIDIQRSPSSSLSNPNLDSPMVTSTPRGLLRTRDKSTTVEFLNQVEENDGFDLKKEIANVRRRDNRYSLFLPNPVRTSFMWPFNDSLRIEDEALKTAESLLKSLVNVVNDDNSFPDSVTPTKVDQKLVTGGYDIPYMDDAAFFCGTWYGGEDHRWSQLYLSEADLRFVQEIQIESAAEKPVTRKPIPKRTDPSLRHSAKLASNESLTEKPPPTNKRRRSWFTLCKCTRRPRE